MNNPFNIVKDSSVWYNHGDFAAVNSRDPMLRIGIVKRARNDENTGELRYLVEIQNHNDKIELNCSMLRRFGGVYNYEDFIMRGYNINDKPDPVAAFDAKAGDVVLVGQLNGQGREGVIIGSLTHPARHTVVDTSAGPQYKAEFNGVETSINASGELTVTFKGQPTNLDMLNSTPGQRIQPAQYNTSVGSSYYKFDSTGSYTVSDNSQGGIQMLKLDKPGGTVSLLSGPVSLKMSKGAESVEWKSKTMVVNATDKSSTTTKEFTVDATTRSYIKSPKVAIGTDAIELLDQIAQLIEKLGAVQPISPIGPCSSLMSSPGWPGVEVVKGKIKSITGGF